jgi:hypothetical protein
MTQEQEQLHNALQNFDIDGGAVDLSFSHRLARENGWTLPFAERVVEEYKKFVFLASTGKHPVTPSHQVDQAWHLHMTYTDSYWTRMCGELLPRPLHHNPTKGGKAEGEKFDHWYNRTLNTYEQVCGEPPPSDVWPCAEIRFGRDTRHVFVNTDLNYIIPKRRVRSAGRSIALLGLGGVLLAGCTTVMATATPIWGLLIFIAIVVLIGYGFYYFINGPYTGADKKRGQDGSGCGTSVGEGCSTGSLTSGDHSGGHSGCSSSGCSGGSGCGGGGCGGGGCGGGGD